MKTLKNTVLLSAAMTLAVPSFALAEGLYVTGQLGGNLQTSAAMPFGQNIATDADFPAEFDGGAGLQAGLGLGYAISDTLRVEARLAYQKSRFDDTQMGTGARDGEEYILNGGVASTSFTVEGFYDFDLSGSITPFVKAGLGVSSNSVTARLGGEGVAAFDAFDGEEDGYYDAYADETSTAFTWNIGTGASFDVSEKVALFGEYQFASYGDVQTGQDSFTDGFKIDNVLRHSVVIGARFNF
ncbi:outer membrane protein [Marinicellulosiphila megalodicopiae]|uniref:outer membrane protein n=1 Tax=Marinicellulosiphila megalodicopiae TaxID=2724896 RepID=UPI003BAE6FAF